MKSFQIGDLTVPVPIVQGGMGIGISMSGLASAVANAGGIGVISTVALGLVHGTSEKKYAQNNIDGLIKEIRKARALTKGIVGVNIMTVLTDYVDLVKTSIKEKIDVIFSGAGLPLDLPKYKTAGSITKLVPIVSSARAARVIYQKWINNYKYIPDAFVVEGPKAGGHLGFSPKELHPDSVQLETLVADTLKVTSEIKEKHNRDIPVIAAGGVTTGLDMYDLINMGASAVQIGSRFVATFECDASTNFKQEFIKSGKNSAKIIKSPVGLPGRAFQNEFLQSAEKGERKPAKCKYNCIKTCNPKTTAYCIADALFSAYKGDLTNGFVFAGANAYTINSIISVEEVFQQFKDEYAAQKFKVAG